MKGSSRTGAVIRLPAKGRGVAGGSSRPKPTPVGRPVPAAPTVTRPTSGLVVDSSDDSDDSDFLPDAETESEDEEIEFSDGFKDTNLLSMTDLFPETLEPAVAREPFSSVGQPSGQSQVVEVPVQPPSRTLVQGRTYQCFFESLDRYEEALRNPNLSSFQLRQLSLELSALPIREDGETLFLVTMARGRRAMIDQLTGFLAQRAWEIDAENVQEVRE